MTKYTKAKYEPKHYYYYTCSNCGYEFGGELEDLVYSEGLKCDKCKSFLEKEFYCNYSANEYFHICQKCYNKYKAKKLKKEMKK